MAEIVQREYVLVGRAWLYPRVHVANTVHLSKHHSYCLQNQNKGRKDRPPECHWSPMNVTNESLTLHPLSMQIFYPSANEHSLWGCCIFSGSVITKGVAWWGKWVLYAYIYATPGLGSNSCCLHAGGAHPITSSCDTTGNVFGLQNKHIGETGLSGEPLVNLNF